MGMEKHGPQEIKLVGLLRVIVSRMGGREGWQSGGYYGKQPGGAGNLKKLHGQTLKMSKAHAKRLSKKTMPSEEGMVKPNNNQGKNQ